MITSERSLQAFHSTISHEEWPLRSREIAIWARRLADLVVTELSFRGRVSVSDRMRLWRRGFVSRSGELYGPANVVSGGYLSDVARAVLTPRINGRYSYLLDNKLAFTYMIESLRPGTVAPLKGLVLRGMITLSDAPPELTPLEEDPVDDLIDTVVKPIDGALGSGAYFVRLNADGTLTLNGRPATRASILGTVRDLRSHVVTEFVDQAGYSRAIHPQTTNTIRMLTLRCPDTGRTFVPVAVHRFGTHRSGTLDAWHAGGIVASLDLASGALGKVLGAPNDTNREGVAHHPDTGAAVEGVEVPGWAHVVSEITALASKLPFLPYIGWDVVVTDDGFRVLEGNNRTDVQILQIHTPLLRDERVRRFFQHYGVVRP